VLCFTEGYVSRFFRIHGSVCVSESGVCVCLCLCAFDHAKQMLCSNEMAELLSWISRVAACQDGVYCCSPTASCESSSRKPQELSPLDEVHICLYCWFSPRYTLLLMSTRVFEVVVGLAARS